jgi:hypothetical protein
MKAKLEIGDKIQRFEVQLSREIDFIYEIESVTKTLAKTKNGDVFKIDLDYSTTIPKKSTNKIIAEVNLKGKTDWCTPRYYLIEKTN